MSRHEHSYYVWKTYPQAFMYKCVPSYPAAGAIINPPKSVEQVETEAQEGHQSYICSHNAYFLGEYCGHVSLFGSDSVQRDFI